MRYRAVIFDLDDTLLKTAVIKWAHHKAVAKHFYDIDLTDEVLAKHWGMPFEPMIAIFYQNSDTPENMLKANIALEAQFQKERQEDALGIITTLLEASVEVGVVTSMLSGHAKGDLLRLGFPVHQFLIVQGADDTPVHKPDPRVFDKTLDLLKHKKIAPKDVVYIGDALMDFYAARDAGIEFMGITTGFVTQQQFEAEGAQAAPSLTHALQHFQTSAVIQNR